MFAQVKEKPKVKAKKKERNSQETAELGFMQLGTVDEDHNAKYSLLTSVRLIAQARLHLKLKLSQRMSQISIMLMVVQISL